MHMLVIFIFMTAEYHHSFATESDSCGAPPTINITNIKSLNVNASETYPINSRFRFECADGYVRKAGTSNLIRCIKDGSGKAIWHNVLPLVCIPDPNKPTKTPDPTTPEQHFTSPTLETTQTSRILTSSMPTAATNEVATSQTSRTTNLPTTKITTEATESLTTTNEIASSTSTTYTSRQFMTTRSSPTPPGPFTATTGVTISLNTSTTSAENDKENFSGHTTSGGLALSCIGLIIILLIFLLAALFFWWRLRHRTTNATNRIQQYHSNPAACVTYIPVPQSDPGHCLLETNVADAAIMSTTDSIHDTK